MTVIWEWLKLTKHSIKLYPIGTIFLFLVSLIKKYITHYLPIYARLGKDIDPEIN